MCLFMKYNPMGINRGLCSLEKLTSQNQKFERNTRNIINPMVILQNCYLQNSTSWLYPRDKFAITLQQQKCGGQILSTENDIVPPSYLLSFIFSINLVLPLLLCIISPTSAVSNEPHMGASLLRLHFYDCFVNASHLSLSLSLSHECFVFRTNRNL